MDQQVADDALAVPGGFETKADALAEDRLRTKLLRNVVPDPAGGWLNVRHAIWSAAQGARRVEYPTLDYKAGRALIRKLEIGVTTGSPSQTLASWLHMRNVRQSVIGALFAASETLGWANLRTFTILNVNWVYTPEQLETVTAAQLKRQLRTHLARIGITATSGFFVAFLHCEFDPVGRRWTLHFHGATTAEIAARLSKLKKKGWGYVKTRTGAAAIRRDRINDPVRQLAYLALKFWFARAVRQLPDGSWKRDRKRSRIPEPYHTQHLLWLDRQRLSDLTVMIGGWSRRRGGNEAMRRLYFSTVEG